MGTIPIKVFLTGATGVMGMAGLKELTAEAGKYSVTVLARNSKKNRRKLGYFEKKGVKVVWGDLLSEECLRAGIENSDIVLHVGGMVSPAADYHPEKTLEVNIGSMKKIAAIVKDIESRDPDREIKVVYIGSVSQYGSKLPPNHWGAAGDPQLGSLYDAYSVSKILAERELLEAGLKKWVCIRQTAILHPGLLKNANNPITFHVPLRGVLEWITTEDSGRILERVCRPDIDESFWNNFYNAGGGQPFRLINLEFERGILKALGCPAPEKVFEPNWFATGNFHGMWFKDSDLLEEYLHFRGDDTFEKALSRIGKNVPFYYKLAPLAPAPMIKMFMKRVANTPGLGTLHWIKTGDEGRLKAYWGGKESYRSIPSWKDIKAADLDRQCSEKIERLQFGEDKLYLKKCDRGHEYKSSASLEAGGHGCPECLFKYTLKSLRKNS